MWDFCIDVPMGVPFCGVFCFVFVFDTYPLLRVTLAGQNYRIIVDIPVSPEAVANPPDCSSDTDLSLYIYICICVDNDTLFILSTTVTRCSRFTARRRRHTFHL